MIEDYFGYYPLQLKMYLNQVIIYSKSLNSINGIGSFKELKIPSVGSCQINITSNLLISYSKTFEVFENMFEIDFQTVMII